jgi:hypothetical protein
MIFCGYNMKFPLVSCTNSWRIVEDAKGKARRGEKKLLTP